jgi:hypothetical protein
MREADNRYTLVFMRVCVALGEFDLFSIARTRGAIRSALSVTRDAGIAPHGIGADPFAIFQSLPL